MKNYNPTNKEVFVQYECPNCHRIDCSCIPPVMKMKIPFFIVCSNCGGFVMYARAWVVEPYKTSEVLLAVATNDKKILNELKPGGKFKEVTDKLDPDGTMDPEKDMLNIDIDMEPMIDEKRMKRGKNLNPVSAKQVCPICNNEFVIKDIDLYLERMEEAWNVVKIAMPDAYKEQMEHELYKRNHPDAIRKLLKEKGYFTGLCQPCMSKLSWSKQLNLGL